MNPRIRRLQADQESVRDAFAGSSIIRIVEIEGEPAERYVVEYHVAGLVLDDENRPQIGRVHRAEIFLPIDYPRRPPFCRMISPVFHPNIDPQKICMGDHWSAGQKLTDLICRIGEMIAFQSYNIKSPLNAQAARWAEENMDRLPLQAVDLSAG
jgi:ubiquitin-protein ligase